MKNPENEMRNDEHESWACRGGQAKLGRRFVVLLRWSALSPGTCETGLFASPSNVYVVSCVCIL